MPHQCLRCESVFDNSSDAIIKGCPNCGNKLFLFIRKDPKNDKKEIELTKQKKEIILKEVEDLIGNQEEIDMPIVLKLENIRVVSPGKYELDINQLMKKEKPIIYKVQDGTYVIDIDFILKK